MCVITFALWLTIHPKCVFKLRKEALYFMHEITTITEANVQNMKRLDSMLYIDMVKACQKDCPKFFTAVTPSKCSISGKDTSM